MLRLVLGELFVLVEFVIDLLSEFERRARRICAFGRSHHQTRSLRVLKFCFQFFTQFDELRSRFLIYLAETQAKQPTLLIDVAFQASLNYSASSN